MHASLAQRTRVYREMPTRAHSALVRNHSLTPLHRCIPAPPRHRHHRPTAITQPPADTGDNCVEKLDFMTTALRFMFRCIVEDIERIVGGDSASGPAGAAMGYARFAHGLAEVAFNPAVGPMLAFESLLVLAIMRLQKKKFVQEQRTYIIRFPAR